LEPHTRLVFSFGWEHAEMRDLVPPGSTQVEVTLTADGEYTEVVLRHSLLPIAQAAEHAKGWQLFVGERLAEAVALH
jgi:uncharacterized protein YndB with AHSA1/START domain